MDESSKKAKVEVKYPYVSFWIGIILSLLYLWQMIYTGMVNHAALGMVLVSLVFLCFYWVAAYKAKQYFKIQKIGVWGVRMINIGGLLLVFFGSLASCALGVRIG